MADINDLKDICISSGTLRAEDLLPRFMGILKDYAPEKFNEFIKGYPELDGWEDFLEADWRIISDDTKMNASDELFGLLNDIAPEGTMFSSTEGDGADFGFWTVEEKLLNDDEGEKALKKLQGSLSQYKGKSTGEVAADIRYDVATALDMAADKVEDLMFKFGLDNIYVLRAKGLSPKAIAKKILKADGGKSEGIRREALDDDPPEWREHGCASRAFLERFGVALRDSGLPWTLSTDNTIYDMVEVYTDITSLFGFKPSTEVGHIDYESKNVSGNDAILLDIVKECEEDIAPVGLAFDGHDGIMRWVTCYLPHASMEGGYAEHIEDDTWPTIPECIDMTLEALDTVTKYLKKSASGLKSSESKKSESSGADLASIYGDGNMSTHENSADGFYADYTYDEVAKFRGNKDEAALRPWRTDFEKALQKRIDDAKGTKYDTKDFTADGWEFVTGDVYDAGSEYGSAGKDVAVAFFKREQDGQYYRMWLAFDPDTKEITGGKWWIESDESKDERRDSADYLQEVWDALVSVWDKKKFDMAKGYDDEYECEAITIASKDNEDVRAKIYVDDHEGKHPVGFDVIYRYPGDKGVGDLGYYEFQSTDFDETAPEIFAYFDELKGKVGEAKGDNWVAYYFCEDPQGLEWAVLPHAINGIGNARCVNARGGNDSIAIEYVLDECTPIEDVKGSDIYGKVKELEDRDIVALTRDEAERIALADDRLKELKAVVAPKDEAADSRRVDDYANKRFFDPEEFVKYVRKAYGKDGGYVSIDSVVPVSVLNKANRMAQKNGYKKMEANKPISCNALVAALQEKGFDVKEDLNGSYRIVAKGDNFDTTDNLLFITTLYPESTSDRGFVSDSAFVRGRVNGNRIVATDLKSVEDIVSVCVDAFGKKTETKNESLTLKQKELKDMARYGEAEDITTISDAEAKELKKKGIETVGVSRGTYGMNGALLRDREGNKYVITARSSNLFYFV